jgi:hypothetical protein
MKRDIKDFVNQKRRSKYNTVNKFKITRISRCPKLIRDVCKDRIVMPIFYLIISWFCV